MDLNLKDRNAFVTGASRGIGYAIAEAFAREGVHLALFGRDETLCADLAARHQHRRQPRPGTSNVDDGRPDQPQHVECHEGARQ